MTNGLYYAALIAICLSALVGLLALRLKGDALPRHLRVFSIVLLGTAMVEIGVYIGITYLNMTNNLAIYNTSYLFYFMGYSYYFKQIIHSNFVRRMINIFLYSYPIFWFVVVFFVFKVDEWNSYSYLVGSLFTVIWALAYCYELFVSEENVHFAQHSEFWIAIGLFMFYICNLPYMGMFNFLGKNYADLVAFIRNLLLFFNILMYTLFSYAFLCQMINTKKS